MAFNISVKIWWGALLVAVSWCMDVAGDCNITLGNHTYKEETLVSNVPASRGLAVDFITHNVYFSFRNGLKYSIAKVDIRNKNVTVIDEIRGPCGFTVNQERGYVLAGCSTYDGGPGGLYQWDSNIGRFQLAGEAGRDIHFVYYHNDTLFYSFRGGFLLHTFTNGHSILASAPASQVLGLVVNTWGDFIFTNWTGVYLRHGVDMRETRYEMFNMWVLELAVDSRGAAYTCDTVSPRGVWRLDNRTLTATRLLNVKCSGLAFDKDGNIIYADITRESIIRLVKC